jgi:hypothetical protein
VKPILVPRSASSAWLEADGERFSTEALTNAIHGGREFGVRPCLRLPAEQIAARVLGFQEFGKADANFQDVLLKTALQHLLRKQGEDFQEKELSS